MVIAVRSNRDSICEVLPCCQMCDKLSLGLAISTNLPYLVGQVLLLVKSKIRDNRKQTAWRWEWDLERGHNSLWMCRK